MRANHLESKLSLILWAYQVSCKATLGTTSFELVNVLNSIVYFEFLVPTIRVAKKLEWAGHVLMKSVEELEKLDETSLLANGGMYVETCRRKHRHDQNN